MSGVLKLGHQNHLDNFLKRMLGWEQEWGGSLRFRFGRSEVGGQELCQGPGGGGDTAGQTCTCDNLCPVKN